MTPQEISARVHARRLAMQAVYQIELAQEDVAVVKEQFHADESFGRADAAYFDRLVAASQSCRDEIIEKISTATEWRRIDPVERAILRNAVYEILYVEEVDDAVAITEAVRLARKFGASESYRLVNSVLEHLVRGCRLGSEHDLIAAFFTRPENNRSTNRSTIRRTILGPGDDAAIIDTRDVGRLACSVDTLIEGVHFLPSAGAASIGHKALAVSLSDIAAMGAAPKWSTLSLTAPHADRRWFQDFSDGFFRLADAYGVELIGGDLTRGALSITTQVIAVPEGEAMLRKGARPGDGVYVTGNVGGAALAWAHTDYLSTLDKRMAEACMRRLHCPQPRVREGAIIARYASAGTDISDGLLKDLLNITGGCGAEIHLDRLPLNAACARFCKRSDDYTLPLAGGDDYELLFTMDPEHEDALETLLRKELGNACVPFTCIGRVNEGHEITGSLRGEPYRLPDRYGFDHFPEESPGGTRARDA